MTHLRLTLDVEIETNAEAARPVTVNALPDTVVIDGIELPTCNSAGRLIHVCINHDATAIGMHAANHPFARHLKSDVWHADPRREAVEDQPAVYLRLQHVHQRMMHHSVAERHHQDVAVLPHVNPKQN
ncbi:MAG: hypothetical protein IT475_18565 [Aquimonas sp.]|nr:hypothetical protein [Aquimonas sp.]